MRSAPMMGRTQWREGGWFPHFILKRPSPAALAFLLAFLCVSGLHAGTPALFCATPSHDFGVVTDSSMVSNVFIVENRGDAPLRLGDMRVCCGGTMQVSAKDIPREGRAEIAVSLSARGRSGMQNTSMYTRGVARLLGQFTNRDIVIF